MVQLVPTEQRSLVRTLNNEKKKKSVSVAIFPLLVLRFFLNLAFTLFKGVISSLPKHFFFCIFIRIRLFVLPR